VIGEERFFDLEVAMSPRFGSIDNQNVIQQQGQGMLTVFLELPVNFAVEVVPISQIGIKPGAIGFNVVL